MIREFISLVIVIGLIGFTNVLQILLLIENPLNEKGVLEIN